MLRSLIKPVYVNDMRESGHKGPLIRFDTVNLYAKSLVPEFRPILSMNLFKFFSGIYIVSMTVSGEYKWDQFKKKMVNNNFGILTLGIKVHITGNSLKLAFRLFSF